ncbi:MAG: hypothetical protein U1G08_02495 [Verrucomicrobiota bacterium]
MHACASKAPDQVELVAVPGDRVSEAIITPKGDLVGFVFRQQLDLRARLVVARDRWEWHSDLAKRWGVHGVYGQRDWLKKMIADQSEAPKGRAIIFP